MSKNEKINIAVVGAGWRGAPVLNLILEMDNVNVVGVCDLYQDRLDAAAAAVVKAGQKKPMAVLDYRRFLDLKKVDAVLALSSWTSHAQICIDAMDAGKYAATEVGGATSIEQCWDLVRTSERTGMPCMLLENCCYGRLEMAVLNMISKGLFGELVHAEGGYRHDLRTSVWGNLHHDDRYLNYSNRCCDVYPTHDIGPISKYLGINRGNRMLTLNSVASQAAGVRTWARTKGIKELYDCKFAMGDVITTIIKCAHGQTITLYHDTTLPRPYSRCNLLQGTRGICSEDKNGGYFEGVRKKEHEWTPMEELYKKYEHPLWKAFQKEGVRGGHGGMDWLVLSGFFEAVRNRTQPPIDVYDTASWMAVTPLSEDSCAMGGAPVAFPDFTNGRWISREPAVRSRYCLNEICG